MTNEKKTERTGFRTTPRIMRLLLLLAEKMRRSTAQVIEIAIEELAKREGIE